MYVADIHTDCSPRSVRFIDLLEDQVTQGIAHRRRLLGVVSAVDLAVDRISQDHSSNSDRKKYQHALSKGRKTASRVRDFLSGAKHLHEGPFVELSEDAIISGSPYPGVTRDREGVTSFHKMIFHFPYQAMGVSKVRDNSAQMLHISCPGFNADSVLVDQFGRATYDSITIISGMCLFSEKILRSSIMDKGSLDISKLYYPRPTLYEMEVIARSASVIADIAAQMLARDAVSKKVSFQIVLDLPSWHYYQIVHDSFVAGQCSSAEALDWLQALELRCEQMAVVFGNAVRHEIDERGVGSGSYEILVAPGTASVGSTIQSSLMHNTVPDINECLASVCQMEGESWAAFYSLVPEKEKPQTFKSLGFLFYVYEAIRPALRHLRTTSDTRRSGSTARPLIISVDDRAERKIYSKSQDLIKKIRKASNVASSPTLIEVYVARRVFFDGNADGGSLYWNDPSPDYLGPRSFKDSARLYGQPELQVWQIIRALYGNECALNLERWFLEVGLFPRHLEL
ncbi:hypothetical protein JX265_008355 [Neoarthrinium moseri]|uniref:Uncharacterized protein n=1 Tax=Neoarthrinium moseri TaxID=1658444 RepID=A0A9Q0AMJ3_9PEZI|nr:hypothetical protein JX265_008355 [Neoarthrinium moseri]